MLFKVPLIQYNSKTAMNRRKRTPIVALLQIQVKYVNYGKAIALLIHIHRLKKHKISPPEGKQDTESKSEWGYSELSYDRGAII